MRRIVLIACLVSLALLALGSACLAQDGGQADSVPAWQLPPLYLFSWLLPLGLTLAAVGLREPGQTQELATALPLALVIALGGYLLCGFGLQLGGVGLVAPHPELRRLTAEWSPLDLRAGPGWGLVGLRAIPFVPARASATERALFMSQLPWVVTAALIPLTSLNGRAPRLATLIATALAAWLCYPLAGNWILSGGWLSRLGATLGLGRGFLDSGAGFPLLIGSLVALAGLVVFRRRMLVPLNVPPELPQAPLPLYVLTGAFLAFLGWLGGLLSQPLGSLGGDTSVLLLNAVGAVAGASAGALFYGWLARGRPEATLSARGFIAGLAAISGAAPWISFSSALFLGAAAGLLLAPVTYVTERTLKLEDSGAAAGMLALPALLGLLAAGQVTTRTSPVQGQLQAQLVGMGALVVLAGVAPWIVLGILAQGYALGAQVAPRLPARVRRAEGQAEKRAPVEPPHPGLWQRARVRWARLRVPTGRRLRHRRRSAANPSEWSAPAEVSDSAGDA